MSGLQKSLVYFLRPLAMEGPVKIGVSASPASRLASYIGLAPWPLELAATLKGDAVLERRFHAKFVGQHYHHEWFHPSKELTRVIAEVAAGTFDVAELPNPARLPPSVSKKPWTQGMRLAASFGRRIDHLRYVERIQIPEPIERARRMVRELECPASKRLIEEFLSIHAPSNPRRAA